MNTTIIAIIASLAMLVGCDKDPEMPMPMPVPSAPAERAERVQEDPPPPPLEFPIEENALATVQAFDVMPGEPTYVLATSNAQTVFELLQVDDPEPVKYGPDYAIELLDLHPVRLEAAGLDPKRPVGIAIYGENRTPTAGGSWVVFATLKDERKFRDAFDLAAQKPDGSFAPNDTADKREFLQLANGEVVIATKIKLQTGDDAERSLAQDGEFNRLVKELDYGALGTAYVRTRRGHGIHGVGIDERGLGVKALAAEELFAANMRIHFLEDAASIHPEVPYAQRVINARAELHTTGRELRQELNALEAAPRKRRTRAAKTLLSELDEVGSLDASLDSGFHAAGRVWKVSTQDLSLAYGAWVRLGPTTDELERHEQIAASLRGLTVISGTDIGELTPSAFGQGDGGAPGLGNMGPMGGMLQQLGGMVGGEGGGKGKKGEKASGPMAMLDNLGGLGGGGFFGGKKTEASFKVTASDARLSDYVKKKMARLTICLANADVDTSVTMVADLEVAPETGTVKVNGLRGAPNGEARGCVRRVLTGRTAPPKPDPESPDEDVRPITGWVRMALKQ